MKHIEVAWIEQILTFDDPHEVQSYLDELDSKGIQYSVIKREMSMLRIRRQYNKNTLLRKGGKRMFDYSKLRGKIKEVFGTQSAFAKAMGLSGVSLSSKLNNITHFTQVEINRACELLSIPVEFIPVYFFTEKVESS